MVEKLPTLEGRVVLIAGASSGMGRATALAAGAEGARVVLAARNAGALAEVETMIESAGGSATSILVDVTNRASVDALVEQARNRLGRIDAVVITAGTNIKERRISELTSESWSDMVAVNLTASFNVTQAVLPVMREQQDGLIIYISSSAAKKPDASGVAYQATKAGLVGLAHGAMEEERPNGIRTTIIFPGLTDTPMVLNRPTPTPPETLRNALQPEDVASACLFAIGLPARAHVPELVLYPSRLG